MESTAPTGGQPRLSMRNQAKSNTLASPAAAPMTTRKRTRRWVSRDGLCRPRWPSV